MKENNILYAYTAEALAWNLGGGAAKCTADTASPASSEHAPNTASSKSVDNSAKTAARILRMAELGNKKHILLLGSDDSTLAGLIASALPDNRELIIVESDPDIARKIRSWQLCHKNVQLLADTSPFAIYLLALYYGLTPANCAVCRNHTVAKKADSPLATFEKLFLRCREIPLPHAPKAMGCIQINDLAPAGQESAKLEHSIDIPGPERGSIENVNLERISACCILHPEEKHLDSFFAQFPSSLREVVVVWDAEHPPRQQFACTAPLRHFARPLAANFAAQRNAMLENCRGDFCFYLDADERLEPKAWSLLPRLASLADFGGAYFPRITFEKDEQHARMGYGLWPDLQMRFFAIGRQRPVFCGAVHEKVEGLSGRLHLVPGASILHYSHVHKNNEELDARLKVFNAAAKADLHCLSRAYPHLPLNFFIEAALKFGMDSIILLPDKT